MINWINSFFAKGDARAIRAKRNIIVSFICKGLTILIGFVIVPLTLGYVGETEYGIWLTIASIVSWFSFFDIGLGNGLRNKLAEALAKNDLRTARIYISSTYALITIIASVLFIAFLIIATTISWNSVLNTFEVSNNELFNIVVFVFFFFCLGFIMKILSSILQALQQYAINDVLGVLAQILGLVVIYMLTRTTDSSLFYLCLVYGSKLAFVLLVASIVLFSTSLNFLKPRFKYINFRKALPLMSLGVWFFIGQILFLILNHSSSFLVIQFFGPKDVTIFNIAKKYMTVFTMLYIMVLTPYLSAFTEAYTKNELFWIRKTISKIRIFWVLSSFAIVLSVFIYPWFFKLWVGGKIVVPQFLIIVLAISAIISTLGNTYTLFLNGIGKIRLQIYLQLFQAILFIPMVFLFYSMDLGLSSMVIPNILYGIVSFLVFLKQYNKIISRSANGVWNK